MPDTLILGLGNILCGDEGIGCRVAEYLFATRVFPENVAIADGGTMGQELLDPVMSAKNLLVIDCCDFGMAAGQCEARKKDGVPIWLGMGKMSPHQGSFSEVLALADLKNQLPENIILLAIQPERLEFGEKLSPKLREKLEYYARESLAALEEWGIKALPRHEMAFLSDTAVALQNYETELRFPKM